MWRKTLINLRPEEVIIKTTRPHPASFLGSPYFWIGLCISIFGIGRGARIGFRFVGILLVIIGCLFIGFSYIRRVFGYKYFLTNQRIISKYRFLRKLSREISYEELKDTMIEQGIFAKIFGYTDVWLYGHRNEWIVGRMRGVSLGDWHIIKNKAWNKKLET